MPAARVCTPAAHAQHTRMHACTIAQCRARVRPRGPRGHASSEVDSNCCVEMDFNFSKKGLHHGVASDAVNTAFITARLKPFLFDLPGQPRSTRVHAR
jgi:hypothetical protein